VTLLDFIYTESIHICRCELGIKRQTKPKHDQRLADFLRRLINFRNSAAITGNRIFFGGFSAGGEFQPGLVDIIDFNGSGYSAADRKSRGQHVEVSFLLK